MKLKAYDKVRKQYIPQSAFALTGDGRLLIVYDEYELGHKMGEGWGEQPEVPTNSVRFEIEND